MEVGLLNIIYLIYFNGVRFFLINLDYFNKEIFISFILIN